MDTTIAKGLKLLDLVVNADSPVGISAAAREMGLEKSNVHRTMMTLVHLGFVKKDKASGRYVPTLRVWEFGTKVLARNRVHRVVRPFLQQLHQQTSETLNLAILDGTENLYLEQLRAPVPVRTSSVVGERVPAIFPASGKAMLAFHSDAESIVIDIRDNNSHGRSVSVDAVMGELRDIRARGYALSQSGWTTGVNSVASAIVGKDGQATAAISVSGPAERMPLARMEALAEHVLNACTQASYSLGNV
jgi:IclR family transcriptional regulator, KDG regulon repressor